MSDFDVAALFHHDVRPFDYHKSFRANVRQGSECLTLFSPTRTDRVQTMLAWIWKKLSSAEFESTREGHRGAEERTVTCSNVLNISIFRLKHQNIEDHHIDEVIKYYWCWGNIEKIKGPGQRENFKLFVFSFASLSLSVVTICMTRVMASCRNSIDYVSLSLCDFFLLYLPFCLIESFFWLARIAFLLAHFSHILPLEIESKSLLLLKYNIIVGERRRRRREREREREKAHNFSVESHSLIDEFIEIIHEKVLFAMMSGGKSDDQHSTPVFSIRRSSLFWWLGRILYNVPCSVCHDNSSGKHYSVYACDGYVN